MKSNGSISKHSLILSLGGDLDISSNEFSINYHISNG